MKLARLGPSLFTIALAACTQGGGQDATTTDAAAEVAPLADAAADGSGDLPAAAEAGRDTGAAETERDADRTRLLPQPACVWNEAYQENYAADTVAEILAGARGCYVLIDPFANRQARTAIPQMQQLGNVVGCYISVGTCEEWRDDFAAMKPYCVSKQWGEWPGEYFVDRTEPGLIALMQARIDAMAAWGCDFVELDNMDFALDDANRSQYAITATAAQGAAYDQALCDYMHGKGMGCMGKSSTWGTNRFDGLTVESSRDDMDWWTATELSGVLAAGKPGIVVHYDESDCAGVRAQYQSKYGGGLSFICEERALGKYRHFP
jgi:cysteinyl-tRNA synthetase, unknown class